MEPRRLVRRRRRAVQRLCPAQRRTGAPLSATLRAVVPLDAGSRAASLLQHRPIPPHAAPRDAAAALTIMFLRKPGLCEALLCSPNLAWNCSAASCTSSFSVVGYVPVMTL
jgi:hypothetical protein